MTAAELKSVLADFECEPEPQGEGECYYHRRGLHGKNVTELNTIAGQLVDSWTFKFHDGRLAMVIVFFPEEGYEDVISGMRAKFGAPAGVERRALQNRAGARFMSIDYRWASGPDTLQTTQYINDIKTSGASLSSRLFEKYWRDSQKARETRRAKDL